MNGYLRIVIYSMNDGGVPKYNNQLFTTAYNEAYFSFIKSQDPNVKISPDNLTPGWRTWNGRSEMMFNRTEAGEPFVQSVRSNQAMLERCE